AADLFCGSLDGTKLDCDGNVVVWGWAYDPRTKRPARAVTLFLNQQQVPVQVFPGTDRPDVAAHLRNSNLAAAGWMSPVARPFLAPGKNIVEAYALLEDGQFGKLVESAAGSGLFFLG